MTDLALRDQIIDLCCGWHDPSACQDTDCSWCDNAALRADQIRDRIVGWLCTHGHEGVASDLADEWDGLAAGGEQK